jgi:hypothetical protein
MLSAECRYAQCHLWRCHSSSRSCSSFPPLSGIYIGNFFAKISLKLRETATHVYQRWSYLCYLGRCSSNRRGDQKIGIKLPNFSRSCQNSCQGKKCQNIHIKTAQFEGSKHQYQTTFETFKFLQPPMF